jgi:hypothetical protein
MRAQLGLLIPLAALLVSCGSEPKPTVPAEAPKTKAATAPKPADESSRFPKPNLIDTKVVDDHLIAKPFMPGGTIAHYKKGKLEYDMFITKLANPTDAAILLPDWRKALTDAKLIPSFGGYYGTDAGRPIFVFSKGAWIAGIVGLPKKDADAHARVLAAALN